MADWWIHIVIPSKGKEDIKISARNNPSLNLCCFQWSETYVQNHMGRFIAGGWAIWEWVANLFISIFGLGINGCAAITVPRNLRLERRRIDHPAHWRAIFLQDAKKFSKCNLWSVVELSSITLRYLSKVSRRYPLSCWPTVRSVQIAAWHLQFDQCALL